MLFWQELSFLIFTHTFTQFNFGEKMKILINDKELLAKMGENSREICKARFEVGIINKYMRETLGY